MTIEEKLKIIIDKLMPEEVKKHHGNENHGNEIVGDMRVEWECKIGDVLQWGQDNDELGFLDAIYDVRPKDKLSRPIEPTEEFSQVIDMLYLLIEEQGKTE